MENRNVKNCLNCNKENVLRAKFCIFCGNKLENESLYCCWIGNLSTRFSIAQLEKHFYDEAVKLKFIPIHSVKIEENKNDGKYQCFMNFLSLNVCNDAFNHFNEACFDKLILKAEVRKHKFENDNNNNYATSMDKDGKSSIASNNNSIEPRSIVNIDNENINEENANNDYDGSSNGSDNESICPDVDIITSSNLKKEITIFESKYLKKELIDKIKIIQKMSPSISFEINESKKRKIDLICIINCDDKDTLDRTEKIIQQFKVFKHKINLNKMEMSSLLKIKQEFFNYIKRIKDFVNINYRRAEITVYSFCKKSLDDSSEMVRKFLINKIETKEVIIFSKQISYNLVKYALSETSFLKKSNLDNFNFEFKDPSNEINSEGLVTATGKKGLFERINFSKKIETFTTENNITADKSVFPFIKHKLNILKNELKKNFIFLNYSENTFEVCGFNENENDIESNVDRILKFIQSAKTTTINLKKNTDKKNLKLLLYEFRKNEINKNQNDDLYDVDINYKEDSNLIFINGTDGEELNEIKESLLKKIDGSKEITKILKVKNDIYSNHLIKNEEFFNELRKQNRNVKIFSNMKVKPIIRLIGQLNEVNKVNIEIENFLNTFSSSILISNLKLKKNEYEYILNQKHEIDKIKNQSKTKININDFKVYLTINIPHQHDVKILLLKGDFTKIDADAYVNPVNNRLQHNSGLAKAIIDVAGENIQKICDNFIKINGQLNEGDVFTTESGNLGVKMSSIILHAVGPFWKGNKNNEELKLNNVILKCLAEADRNQCNSIVIPAVSTGIFNYPEDKALNVISDAIFDYFSTKKSKLSNIILINDTESITEKWETILRYISLSKNYTCEPAKINSSKSNSWYWRDDEGNWKAYISALNEYIESKYFEFKNSNGSPITIISVDGFNYRLDFLNNKQTNILTGYVHAISNQIPYINKYQWNWLDDNKNRSPFSIHYTKIIEDSYLSVNEYCDINIKRHDNDTNEIYRIFFSNKSSMAKKYLTQMNIQADGIQINLRTQFHRPVFREKIVTKANIQFDDNNNNLFNYDCQLIFISGFETNKTEAIKNILNLINKAYIEETIQLIDISNQEITTLQKQYNIDITKTNDGIKIKGLPDSINKVKTRFLEISLSQKGSKINYPTNWDKMHANEKLKLVSIQKNTEEYLRIYNAVSQTVPNADIIKIERIQNQWLWKLYFKQTEILKEKGVDINEKWLFHGTRNTDPVKIYDDETGFDMRYSSSGMWGIGIYFAINASYSKNAYTFRNNDGTRSMFYARVALGSEIHLPPDSSLRLPPFQSTKKRFDSIKGTTGGTDIYIIYENSRAYPDYLITFRN